MRRTRTFLAILLAWSLGACAETHLVPVDPDAGPATDGGAVCTPESDESAWSSTGGPHGGSIDALAFDGSSYLAVSNRVLFRAASAEGPWIAMPQAGDMGIRPTIAASADGWFALAATGVVWSSDSGLTWTTAVGLEGATVTRLASSEGETIAVADTGIFVWSGGRWDLAVEAPLGGAVEALRTSDGWIARSSALQIVTSSGAGWVESSLSVVALDLAAAGSALVVLANGGEVFRSTDDGASWSSIGRVTDSLAGSIGITQDGSVFVLGFGGRVWRSTGASFEPVDGFASDRATARLTEPETWFVTDGPRAFLFADGGRIGRSETGASIEARPSPIPSGAHALGCSERACLAAGADLQLYRYEISNETWEALGGLTGRAFSVTAIASIEGELWMGTGGDGVYALDGVVPVPVGIGIPGFNGSAGSQTFPVTGLVHFRGATFVATSGAGVYRMLDGSSDWLPINAGIPVVSNDDFGRPARIGLSALVARDHLVAGGASPFWLDAGSGRWEPASAPSGDAITALASSDAGVFALARVESSGAYRLLRSDDGRLFEPVPIPARTPNGLAAFGGELWIAGEDGVWRSRDRGDTWQRVEDGLGGAPTSLTASALAVSADALWLSTADGVYRRPIRCEVER